MDATLPKVRPIRHRMIAITASIIFSTLIRVGRNICRRSAHKGRYTKEAWACMSHIVLEGRRKTRMDNVITVHAKCVEPLYILIHGLKSSYVLKYKEA